MPTCFPGLATLHHRVPLHYFGYFQRITQSSYSFLQTHGDVGLCANEEHLRIFSDRLSATPTTRLATPLGLNVQASNIEYHRTELSLVSEVGVQVGFQLTSHVRLFAGYTFLLWDGVVRSGDQIDPVVNTRAGTAPLRPAVLFKDDLFWAQGLNAGLDFSW
jgi:hypothetical protein